MTGIGPVRASRAILTSFLRLGRDKSVPRDLPTVIVVTENLSSNERVRIATDDPLARDYIVRLHANARTESIIWVLLGIISYGRGLMPLGVTSRIGRFGRVEGGKRHKHAAENNRRHRMSHRYHFH